jgi:hypothetical protein
VLEHDFASRRWRDPAWRAEALRWVDEQLAELGVLRAGAPEQLHAYAWSTVLRVPTDAGPLWFKANALGTAHEGPLLTALTQWAPAHVLQPLAVDLRRGWLLLPDGGATLRAAHAGRTDVAHWRDILVDHGTLQRDLAQHADELVALGVPDVRPERLAGIRAELLDDTAALGLGRPDGLSQEQLVQLRSDASRYAALSNELAATGIPATLQHDDLHDNNVFLPERPGGRYRVFDWGDASVAHPFAVLLVALRVVADRHQLSYGDPELLWLRDAYIEPWTADHDRSTLLHACDLALRVSGVSRALSYRSALLEGAPDDHDACGDAVPGWLLELYEPHPLDSAGWP